MNFEEIKYSIKNVFQRKTRSFLTILSILMGITAIFTLTSFGLGIQNYVNVLAEEAGANKLFVQAQSFAAPGTDENFFITKDEVDFISKIKGVDEAVGLYLKVAEIKSKNQVKYNWIMGYDTDYTELLFEGFGFDYQAEKGRRLKEGDTGKVMLGYNYQLADTVFKKSLNVGDKVELNGIPHEIVGFVTEVGNPADDANIYVTDKTMEILYPTIKDKFGWVMLSAEKGVDAEELAERIEDKLRKRRGQDEGEEDFYVQSFADIIETFGSVISILTGVLILIAIVSLIVAGVNIMNTMYTAVLERTKEIGIMKAIGARNSDILFIFVFESGLLGMLGGVIGVLFGYLIASLAGQIAASAGYSSLYPIFPTSLVLGCILFAFLVGAISGLLPAIRASKLNPTDALRYE